MTMSTTPKTEVRELDRRTSDGIDVRLLWNSHTNRSVAVKDERFGESFEFEVDSADALAAFHHPFAHAQASPHSPHPPGSTPERERRSSSGPRMSATARPQRLEVVSVPVARVMTRHGGGGA
jgi:hypothetical protein